MRIALLNDTHFGCRNDNPAFVKYQNKFYDEVFFPYLIEHNIKTLIHLGDVVDRRKFINHNTAHNFKKNFWNRLENLDIDTHIIIGNHKLILMVLIYYLYLGFVMTMRKILITR